jgi:hypothetical protein
LLEKLKRRTAIQQRDVLKTWVASLRMSASTTAHGCCCFFSDQILKRKQPQRMHARRPTSDETSNGIHQRSIVWSDDEICIIGKRGAIGLSMYTTILPTSPGGTVASREMSDLQLKKNNKPTLKKKDAARFISIVSHVSTL